MKKTTTLGFGFVLVGASILVAAAGCGASEGAEEVGEASQAVCAHGICGAGGALAASCDPCVQQICAVDPFCCNNGWDVTCVGEVASVCKLSCSGGSSSSSSSSTSTSSSSSSSSSSSTSSSSSSSSGGGACAHGTCTAGAKLASTCDPCAQKICATDSYCCNTAWDSICVGEVASICKLSCSGGSSSSSSSSSTSSSSGNLACSHDKCAIGYTLSKSCDPCVTSICTVDPYCCNSDWDNLCVSEVKSVCGINSCPAVNLSVCSHNKCVTGGRLFPACDPCVSTVCGADSYCCGTAWDATCVAEAKSMCGATCP